MILHDLLTELESEASDPSETGKMIATLGLTVVPELLHILKHGKDNIRWRIPSIFVYMRLNRENTEIIVKHLLMALENDLNANVRKSAAIYLSYFAYDKEIIVPHLINHFIYDPDLIVRIRAGESLTHLEDKEAIPSFIEGLKDQDVFIRSISVTGLGKHVENFDLIELLVPMLFDEPNVRDSVIDSLANFGVQAKGAFPLLNELLKKAYRDNNRMLCERLERSLKKIMGY